MVEVIHRNPQKLFEDVIERLAEHENEGVREIVTEFSQYNDDGRVVIFVTDSIGISVADWSHTKDGISVFVPKQVVFGEIEVFSAIVDAVGVCRRASGSSLQNLEDAKNFLKKD